MATQLSDSRLRTLLADLPVQRRDLALLFVLPGLVLFSSFLLYPIAYLLYLSLTNATHAGTVIGEGASLIWFDNYAALFADPVFWNSFGVTWLFVGVSLVLKIVLGVTIALLFTHRRVLGKRYFRAIVIVPMGFPPIFTITVWRGMFSGARFGVFNTFAASYNGFVRFWWDLAGSTAPSLLLADLPIAWLSSRWLAFTAYVTTEVWLAYPFMVIIIVSALQDVPAELHDAAKVDGAGFLARFVNVTLPSIKRPVMFASILTAASSFQQFLIPWVFNNGGPARANELLLVYGYREAIQLDEYGFASAIMVTAIAFIGLFMWLAVKHGRLAEGVNA